MTGPVRIRPMVPADATAVLAIYQAGIDGGNATFTEVAPEWASWDESHLPAHRFVAVGAQSAGALSAGAGPAAASAAPLSAVAGRDGHRVLGWVALSGVSDRCVYSGVAELSIYVHPQASGKGIGSALMATVVESADAGGIWTLQAGIFPENDASVALHLRAGFRIVGRRERLGCQRGVWRDVLLLERRSPVVN